MTEDDEFRAALKQTDYRGTILQALPALAAGILGTTALLLTMNLIATDESGAAMGLAAGEPKLMALALIVPLIVGVTGFLTAQRLLARFR